MFFCGALHNRTKTALMTREKRAEESKLANSQNHSCLYEKTSMTRVEKREKRVSSRTRIVKGHQQRVEQKKE